MTDADAVLEILKRNNPFSSSAAGNPWEMRFPDVPGIGDQAFKGIQKLIYQKSGPPHPPLAGMVTGEAGSGKTHLIGRLIDEGEKNALRFSFAYIQPLLDPYKAFRYLLKEIVINLNRKPTAFPDHTQLDILGGQIFRRTINIAARETGKEKLKEYARKAAESPFKILKMSPSTPQSAAAWLKKSKTMLIADHPELNPEFISVFLQYYFYKTRRAAAVQWMMGHALDASDLKMLGVKNRAVEERESLEEEARDILRSLDRLLHHYSDSPLVVFFDQLENLHDDDVIGKWCGLVYFLSDTCRAMLPLAFFRAEEWQERFETRLEDYCKSRLRSNRFDLEGATREQAIEIVQTRLNVALNGVTRPDNLYPFLPDHKEELEALFPYGVVYPRQAINRANKLLMKILAVESPVRTEVEIVHQAFDTRCREILAHFGEYQPDESRLALALHQYLAHRPEDNPYQVRKLVKPNKKDKFIDLASEVRLEGRSAYPTIFMVDVELHNASVGASLRRGIKHLTSHSTRSERPKSKAVYLRDKRCPFPQTWKRNRTLMEELLALGGGAVFLSKENAVRWYALARLKLDMEAGDVTTEEGKVVPMEKLAEFIRSHLSGSRYPAFSELDAYLGNPAPAAGKKE